MWFASVVIGVLLFSFYRFIQFWVLKPWLIHRSLWKQGIPGQYTPVIGEMLRIREADLRGNPFSYTKQLVKKFGSYYHTSFGPFACLNISDPSLVEGVLKTNVQAYQKSLLAQLLLGALLGNDNLLLAEDDRHARHRRLIAPVFQHKNIHSMISLMAESTQQILKKWTQAAGDTDQVLTVDMHEQMSSLTLHIVTGCVFGTEIVEDNQAHEVIYRNVTLALNEAEKRVFTLVAMIPVLNQLPLPSKRRIEKAREDIRCIVQRIIDQRKKGVTKSACKGPDLLDLLLGTSEDSKTQKLTDTEVLDEALTFVLAGHETTSTLMTWTLYNLATNPEVHRQCLAEVDFVLNNEEELTVSSLSLLIYTEAVLKETLRYHQPVGTLLRTAVKDNTLVASDGKRIRVRKGTDIMMDLHIIHRSEEYWHEPDKFDPSRFLEHHSEMLLAFGAGSRSCIGQNFAMLEAKIMLALIVRRFHFDLVPGKNHAMDTAITIKPKYGMWMRIMPR